MKYEYEDEDEDEDEDECRHEHGYDGYECEYACESEHEEGLAAFITLLHLFCFFISSFTFICFILFYHTPK